MSARPNPPRLARWLLRMLLAPRERDWILGDLDEEFRSHQMTRSWYWSQAFRSVLQGPPRSSATPFGFGGIRTVTLAASSLRDVRFATRSLARTPAFTAAALLTLGLGIGASVAIFSAINEVMLRPLSFAEPDRLVMLWESNREREWHQVHAAPANVRDWRERTTSFEDIAFVNDFVSSVTLGGGARPAPIRMSRVSGNTFSVLGAVPHLGRTFREDETYDEGIAIVSYDAWRRHLGADPTVLGRNIRLDGRPHEVVGVLGPEFRYEINDAEVWVTQSSMAPRRQSVWFRQAHVVRPIARLRDGASFQQAAADLAAVARRLQQEYPETNRGMEAGLTPLHAYLVGDRRPVLLLLLGAVALLQLIACANVATLLMGRSLGRAREMAVRSALGADRPRLVRQLLTESLVLSAAGTALGLTIGAVALHAIAALSPPELEGLVFRLDGRLSAVVAGLLVTSALLFGTLPAWRGSRPGGLRSYTTASADPGRLMAANGFVAFQVGLAVLLVVAAGLMVRSVRQLQHVEPGVDTRGVLTFQVHPPSGTYPSASARADFVDAFLDRLAAEPGVRAVGASRGLPLTGYQWTSDFTIEGWGPEEFGMELRHREATPGYFEALGIALSDGRIYDRFLSPNGRVPVVVNQAFADRYFPDQSPVGRRIAFDRRVTERSYWYDIVGVVGNERMNLLQDPAPEVIAHLRGDTPTTFSFALKVEGDPRAAVSGVRAALARTDPEVPLLRVRTMDDVAAEARASERFLMTLLTVFGLAALMLAAVGVYGVANQAARSRTREVGIRIALGAPRSAIVRVLLARGMVFVALGVVVGVGGALAGGRVMEGLLFQIDPRDPTTLLFVTAIMALVALGAGAWPAWRATHVDPVKALRAEP